MSRRLLRSVPAALFPLEKQLGRRARGLLRGRKQQQVTLDHGGGNVAELVAVVLRVVAEPLEGLVGIDRMAGHEDALRLLDHRAPAERSLKALVLGEALKCDVDRALEL